MTTLTLEYIKARCRVDERTECWVWANCTQANGYGRIRHGGRTYYAHRLAYELANGPIKRGQDIRATCENLACCNPAHRAAGSRAATVKASREAGRQSCGLAHSVKVTPGARAAGKLTMEKARDIRRRKAEGETAEEMAALYGVDVTTVRKVLAHQTWKEPTTLLLLAPPRKTSSTRQKNLHI